MEYLLLVIFLLSLFTIFWGMIGYPLSIKFLKKIYRNSKIRKDYNHVPTVTVMIVAHNEQKVILSKLNNVIKQNYPKQKIKFLVSSDNSTDDTNYIVQKFIDNHPEIDIKLFKVNARLGKTNAQNEAQKIVDTDFLVMTDANSILDENAVKELMASFVSEDIAYVCGKLKIINDTISSTSKAESTYWDKDLEIREIESSIQTITAGNGALYACRNIDYVAFDPIKSHDSSMPLYYALLKKRAVANHDAIVYEKAGEIIQDEFKRKVRMNRSILNNICPDLKIFNFFDYGWFSYFYFGHRTSRYLLWLSHGSLLVSNIFLVSYSLIYLPTLVFQLFFFSLALSQHFIKFNNKYITMTYYYSVTILAQYIGVFKSIRGTNKPFWEKAESTR